MRIALVFLPPVQGGAEEPTAHDIVEEYADLVLVKLREDAEERSCLHCTLEVFRQTTWDAAGNLLVEGRDSTILEHEAR